jgi:hypothetical protein
MADDVRITPGRFAKFAETAPSQLEVVRDVDPPDMAVQSSETATGIIKVFRGLNMHPECKQTPNPTSGEIWV